jgi:hypothetical protein
LLADEIQGTVVYLKLEISQQPKQIFIIMGTSCFDYICKCDKYMSLLAIFDKLRASHNFMHFASQERTIRLGVRNM